MCEVKVVILESGVSKSCPTSSRIWQSTLACDNESRRIQRAQAAPKLTGSSPEWLGLDEETKWRFAQRSTEGGEAAKENPEVEAKRGIWPTYQASEDCFTCYEWFT